MLDIRISVRALAEFALMRGDLFPAMRSIQDMQDGMQGHRLRQSQYADGFESEVTLKHSEEVGGVKLSLFGRADGLNRTSAPPVIEEIKTTRLDPSSIGADDHPAHRAQAELYAYMLSVQLPADEVDVRVTYMHLNGDANTYARVMTRETLREAFLSYALPYAAWSLDLAARKDAALPSMRALSFPFAEYRDGQREMAAQAYRAFKGRCCLLAEAPTGIGKTAASLFAALKAMGEGLTGRIFYLTARTTVRRAAEQALMVMRENGLIARSITLTAKEKLCPHPGTACDPAVCAYAAGYFDRVRDALKDGLTRDEWTRDAIEALSMRHELCPFEFQLDLSETCDVIIGDYNYAFDPRVKLKRFFLDKTDAVLLIDEAHNLIERGREMLSAQVAEGDYRKLLRECAKLTGKQGALYDALHGVVDALRGARSTHDTPGWNEDAPEDLAEKLDIFLDAARPYLGGETAFNRLLTDRYFEALNFTRVAADMSDKHRALYAPGEKDISVKLWCFDPSAYLKKCYERVRGALLFSATLTPLPYYYGMLGLDEARGDAMLALESPFPTEHLCCVRLPINTTFKQREQTAARVAEAIAAMARAKTGNYLACFPSHAYLKMVAGHLVSLAPELELSVQQPMMTEPMREAFLARFAPNPTRTMVALIAMGGVFAEGIDLPGDRLSGAAIVGVGIPQISLERAALCELMNEADEGALVAYVYPGLQKVLQAAGRVIRTETDRGVVLLIDERFFSEGYEALMPSHWHVRDAQDLADVRAIFARFWRQ